jgi:hypothetical protein
MGQACGLAYADVAEDMEWHDVACVRVPVASPSALVRTKDTYRPQGQAAIAGQHFSAA